MNNNNPLSSVIVEYIASRGQEKLEKLDKEIDKLINAPNPEEQAKLEAKQEKRRDESEKFQPRNWLTDAAKRAKQLQLVTHAPKYMHSDARASGMYVVSAADETEGDVCSASLAQPDIDVIGNAAALDVGKLLQLSCDGKALVEYVAADDISPLLPLAESEEQASQWLAGFKQAIDTSGLASHTLCKQLYWPLADDNEYHLLAPLYATSLQHKIHSTIQNSKFSDTAKAVKEAKKGQMHSEVAEVRFPNLAVQQFGGTKPQNISQLNSQRYGKSYLLPSSPPSSWQSRTRLPLAVDTIFDAIFTAKAKTKANKLKGYLAHVAQYPSVLEIRDERARQVDDIIDLLFAYVGEIHQFEPGWSAKTECQLPIDEQLMLDPKRRFNDADFALKWDRNDWPEQIAAKFAAWLNSYIADAKYKGKKVALGDVEFKEWSQLLKSRLRVMRDDFSAYYDSEEKEASA